MKQEKIKELLEKSAFEIYQLDAYDDFYNSVRNPIKEKLLDFAERFLYEVSNVEKFYRSIASSDESAFAPDPSPFDTSPSYPNPWGVWIDTKFMVKNIKEELKDE
jgi:hypothetical protein